MAVTDPGFRPGFQFDNSYGRLPERFYARLAPSPASAPSLIKLNTGLATQLGLDPEALATAEGVALLAGNRLPVGADPLAMAYAGHQFGQFVPQLGDGRAVLLGEVLDPKGRRWDVQLKGAGRTPFSRSGDGRAALGPVLREYIVSEAMQALGVPTTRALAAVLTGDVVFRDAVLPGAVLTRVAASHIRVGTFQYFAARRDQDALRALTNHVMARHDSGATQSDCPPLAMLEAVMDRQAALIAQWMGVGFIHGVMNTDNMTLSGETIDYGPCAFMDTFHPNTVFSSIDQHGRYAYSNQPVIAHWNLARLAETLLLQIDADGDKAVERVGPVINTFTDRFQTAWAAVMRRKLGLLSEDPGDAALAKDLLDLMQKVEADYTLTFRALAGVVDPTCAWPGPQDQATAFAPWLERWRARSARDDGPPAEQAARLRAANPDRIPRNHRVEQALAAATDDGDFAPFERLLAALAHPFDDDPAFAEYRDPPAPEERVLRTFCGT